MRIYKVGLEKNFQILLMTIPLVLIFLLFFYRRSELRFLEIVNEKSREENYLLLKKTIQDLNWRIKDESKRHIEAFTGNGLGITWGDEMITVIIADNTILINCQCNPDYYKTQGFFTFGKLTRTANQLNNQIHGET